MGGLTRSSGVGACEYSTSVATTPIVHSDLPVTVCRPTSFRSSQVSDSIHDVRVAASVGINPFPLASSGMDQLRVAGCSSVDSSAPSASFSPMSLLFPLPDSGVSSLPNPSPSSFSSSVSAFPSVPSASSSAPLPPSPFPLPSFASSSLSSPSFPSYSSVTSALPPPVSSVLPSSSAFVSFPPSASSSSTFASSAPRVVPSLPGFPLLCFFLFSVLSSSSSASLLLCSSSLWRQLVFLLFLLPLPLPFRGLLLC